jgi:hypothetical protein
LRGLIRQVPRWVTVDGPFACASKDDLRQMAEERTDNLELKMVEQVRGYFLVRVLWFR